MQFYPYRLKVFLIGNAFVDEANLGLLSGAGISGAWPGNMVRRKGPVDTVSGRKVEEPPMWYLKKN